MFPAIWQNVKTRPFLRNSCRGQVFCQCGSEKHPIKRPNDHWPWNGRYPELPQDMGDLWSNWVRSDRAKKWGYHRCSIKNTEFLAENAFLFVSIYRIKLGRWWVLILIFRIIKKKKPRICRIYVTWLTLSKPTKWSWSVKLECEVLPANCKDDWFWRNFG